MNLIEKGRGILTSPFLFKTPPVCVIPAPACGRQAQESRLVLAKTGNHKKESGFPLAQE